MPAMLPFRLKAYQLARLILRLFPEAQILEYNIGRKKKIIRRILIEIQCSINDMCIVNVQADISPI